MISSSAQHLRSRLGKVCIALTGSTTAEVIERAASALKESPFVEFRLDYLEKPALAVGKIRQFLAEHTAATAIATCRRAENGGKFQGSVAAQLEILIKAGQSGAAAGAEGIGCQLVDIEIESVEALKKGELQKLRDAGAAIMISHHNFKDTKDLDAIYERMVPFAPDFVKIVPTAKSLVDNVTLLKFIERVSDSAEVVGLSMGDQGIISRVLGLRAGSAFTFAAATVGEETGPGQIAARTLVETYRVEEVDAATRIYGVAGNPVSKSLSPIMMNTAFRRETVNAVYLALQTVKVSDLVGLIQQIPVHGVSITMPHKQEILAHLEHMDPLSKKIGACNTVLRTPGESGGAGKLYGFNTDVAGVIAPLEKRMSLQGAKALVLGAGGAGRAAVFGLRDKGADVFILNRTPETAAKLARQAGAKVLKREAVAKTAFDIVINSTPVGMTGNKAAQILTSADFDGALAPKVCL